MSRFATISGVGFVLYAALASGCRRSPNFAESQPIATPALARAICEGLSIKIADDGSSDLLLMSITNASEARLSLGLPAMDDLPIYRYTHANRGLVAVPRSAWDANRREIASEETRNFMPTSGHGLVHDLRSRVLRWDERVILTAGATVLGTAISADKRYFSALSAEGAFTPSDMFRDPTIPGKRFHQVFRLSDASEVGVPILMRGTTERDDLIPIWTSDNRFVVYSDGNCEHIWVVEVPTAAKAEKTNE